MLSAALLIVHNVVDDVLVRLLLPMIFLLYWQHQQIVLMILSMF